MALDQDLIAAALPLYEVQSELGRGAWGVVLAGRHRELGRHVAHLLATKDFGELSRQLPKHLGETGTVADQSPLLGVLRRLIHGRQV